MVQIPKFWFLNLCTNICPSFGNIHSIKMVINNELTGEETLKTINFKPNFCIENHKKWNNSFFPPWTDLKSHIPWKLLTIRFFWCMAGPWTWKFLLFGFLGSVFETAHYTRLVTLDMAWHWASDFITKSSNIQHFHPSPGRLGVHLAVFTLISTQMVHDMLLSTCVNYKN